jgi:hypothetical protein
MYGWIWRKLPGNLAGKLVGAVVLILAVVAILILVVFPRVGPHLPFDHVTVNSQSAPVSPNGAPPLSL